MHLQITDKYFTLAGIAVISGNAITVGAYSFINTGRKDNQIALWIKKTVHTYSLLDVKKQISLNFPRRYGDVSMCGTLSGRKVNKLQFLDIAKRGECEYLKDAEYVVFANISKIIDLDHHALVLADIVDTINTLGERFIDIC